MIIKFLEQRKTFSIICFVVYQTVSFSMAILNLSWAAREIYVNVVFFLVFEISVNILDAPLTGS